MRVMVIICLMVVCGCSQLGAASSAEINPADSHVATLYGVDVKQNKLWFQVLSNGCTHGRDFSLLTQTLGENKLQVSLIRNKPDYCRAKPRLVPIELALIGAGELQIFLTNPFAKKPHRQK